MNKARLVSLSDAIPTFLYWDNKFIRNTGENMQITNNKESNKLDELDNILQRLNRKYAEKPSYREKISKALERPTDLRNAIIQKYGTICRICNNDGFIKKDGNKYCEVHHMIELSKRAPKTLQSWNVIIVCPNCHKKLHYANVNIEFLNPGWKVIIEEEEHIL